MYVFPVFLYGSEIIIPTVKAIAVLDIQYKKHLKQILSLPSTTAEPAVFILFGTLPAEALIRKRTLTQFENIKRLSQSSIGIRLARRQRNEIN